MLPDPVEGKSQESEVAKLARFTCIENYRVYSIIITLHIVAGIH